MEQKKSKQKIDEKVIGEGGGVNKEQMNDIKNSRVLFIKTRLEEGERKGKEDKNK